MIHINISMISKGVHFFSKLLFSKGGERRKNNKTLSSFAHKARLLGNEFNTQFSL